MKSKAILILILCILCTLTPMLLSQVHAQTYTQYKIQIQSNGSATWQITQIQDNNAPTETWQNFQQKIANLVNSAHSETGRNMSLDNDSLLMQTTYFSETSSKKTEYQFSWLNFSLVDGEVLTAGDVFGVSDFFNQLYGDGQLQIALPAGYKVQSVSPQPNSDQNGSQVLEWFGAQFFMTGKPNIVITNEVNPSPTSQETFTG
jgi:hypothetical protein